MPTAYSMYEAIGTGGMATVHLARLLAPLGFSRVVAIKRLHAGLAAQPDFTAMLVDEARIVARIRHPNVIPILDVLVENSECLLVMEYIEGESLARLLRASSALGVGVPPPIAVAIAIAILLGLHAAHSARSADGQLLGVMHRDVSPQNVLVGSDGVPRLFDFGIAKAAGRLQHTRDGEFKGKLAYVAPEQLRGAQLTQRIDIYSASVVLWETLTSRRLFGGESEEEVFRKVLEGHIAPPSQVEPTVPAELDALVMRGLARSPEYRYETAEEMATLLERAVPPATPREVGAWVRSLAHEALATRAALVARIESQPSESAPALARPLEATPRAMERPPEPQSLGPSTLTTSSRRRASKRRGPLIAIGAAVAGVSSAAYALVFAAQPAASVRTQRSVQASTPAEAVSVALASAVPAPATSPAPAITSVERPPAQDAPLPSETPELSAPKPSVSVEPHARAQVTTKQAPKHFVIPSTRHLSR